MISPPYNFETYLGKVCKRGHDNGSGQSLRVSSSGNCVICKIEYQRAYTDANRQRINEAARQYRNRTGYEKKRYHANKKYFSDKYKRWASKNKIAVKLRSSMYRRGQKLACPAWADKKRMRQIYAMAALLNELSGRVAFHVDHIVPLNNKHVCGLHIPANLRIVAANINLAKSNKFMENLLYA